MSSGNQTQNTFVCDGCGKEAKGEQWPDGSWHKPRLWYQRTDEDGDQLACSRPCIDTVAAATGKTRAILSW